jgi:hypothetical protein
MVTLVPLSARLAVRRCRPAFAAGLLLAVCGCGPTAPVEEPPPAPDPSARLTEMSAAREDVPAPPNPRLFVCRYGTGLDPQHRVEFLPGHVQTLPEIHERYVVEFTQTPGFGMGRYSWDPGQWVELLADDPSSSITEEVFAAAGTGNRDQSRWERPGYDAERKTLRRGGAEVAVRERVWTIRDRQLVSLLKPNSPAVYVLRPVGKHIPRGAERFAADAARENGPAPQVRKLDDFEAAALATLREGKDLVVRTTPDEMRLLGAVRARDGCLKCHGCERGDLLGAFTYTLTTTPEGTRWWARPAHGASR